MSTIAPPEFKNSTKCQSCGTLFGLITRKHHCRHCGNTFCGPHSQKSLPLPSYGFAEPVRVCDKCYDDVRATNGFSDLPSNKPPPVVTTPTENKETESEKPKTAPSSRVPAQSPRDDADEDGDVENVDAAPASSGKEEKKETRKRVANCKCNMPLCICPPDPESEQDKEKEKTKKTTVEKKKPTPSSSSSTPKDTSASPSNTQSTFFGFGQKVSRQYDFKGDLNSQCREAIKAQDIEGVKLLLKAGAKADYKDRTGNTLLHLAAMFDNTELVKVLINAGADPWVQNPSKESAIDIAPPALALKMKTLCPKKEQTTTS